MTRSLLFAPAPTPSPAQRRHPGGFALLNTEVGKDITAKFKLHETADGARGYKHSNAAQNLQATMRVARIQGYWEGQ